jgi:gas vesicle protein
LEKGKETAAQLQERAGEYYEVSREKANELYHTAQEKATEYAELAKDKAGEITEKAKGAAARTSNPISAAIEAGKEAYLEEKRRTETSVISEGRPTYPKDGILELPEEKKK